MKVKNINGTSDTNCKCGSWLEHWEEFSGWIATFCIEKNCAKLATDGAHVQIANSLDYNWYIIPLCREHNKSILQITISNGHKLVPANKKETCEKDK